MLRIPCSTTLITLVLALLPAAVAAQGYPTVGDSAAAPAISRESSRRFQALAPRLVQSARIQPGDLVTISGGPILVPEMEVLGAQVQKAGGYPVLLLSSPRLVRTLYTEVPEPHLDQMPTEWETFKSREVDVAFVLPDGDDYAALLRANPKRANRVDQALTRVQSETAAERNRGKTRTLFVAVPTPSDTASIQMDYRQYEAMTWSAIEADYQAMARKGQEIKRILEGAKRLRITSPEGTDFSVELGDRPVIVRAGAVSPGTQGNVATRSSTLPSGSVRFAPLETTASGKIRAAEDQCSKPVRDVAVDVRDGMPVSVSAASDEECFKTAFMQSGRFGSIVIGLNPAVHFDRVPAYAPQLENSAGVVHIGFASNQDLGGDNRPAPGGWSIPLLRATVEADGKVIVRDGKLTR